MRNCKYRCNLDIAQFRFLIYAVILRDVYHSSFLINIFKQFPINTFAFRFYCDFEVESVREGQKGGGTADSRVSLIKALEVH